MRCELFYANCVLPSRPADVTLDLKKSSFKKQAKLFAVLEKKKLIATKAIHKQDNIVSVNRDTQRTWSTARPRTPPRPPRARPAAARRAGAARRHADKASDEARAALHRRRAGVPRVDDVPPIFGDLAVGNKDRLYDAEECANALRSYCVANDLLKGRTTR